MTSKAHPSGWAFVTNPTYTMREIAPTHSLYGQPAQQHATESIMIAGGREIARAPWSGIEYEAWSSCHAKNFTCTAPKAKGTEYCIGHLRAAVKSGEKKGVTDGSS